MSCEGSARAPFAPLVYLFALTQVITGQLITNTTKPTQCIANSDCANNRACINARCVDPCWGACGDRAECIVRVHNPLCSCPVGTQGDPFTACELTMTSVSQAPSVVLPRGPCDLFPPPCGTHSTCSEVGAKHECSPCEDGYIGSPPNCRAECTVNSACASNRVCVNERCVDLCLGTCGAGAACQAINHNPICSCPERTNGDPFVACWPTANTPFGSPASGYASGVGGQHSSNQQGSGSIYSGGKPVQSGQSQETHGGSSQTTFGFSSQNGGQIVSQGQGQLVSQGQGYQGSGSSATQGQGFGVTQGQGQTVSQGQGYDSDNRVVYGFNYEPPSAPFPPACNAKDTTGPCGDVNVAGRPVPTRPPLMPPATRPPPQRPPSGPPPFTYPTTTTSRPEGCLMPSAPPGGWYQRKGAGGARSLVVTFTCAPELTVSGAAVLYCEDGVWSDGFPTCVAMCLLDPHPSVEYRCLVTEGGGEGTRPCAPREPIGTVVNPLCRRPNYYAANELYLMRCLPTGKWNYVATCTPECGKVTPAGVELVVGGLPARRGELPWHAGIYRKTFRPYLQVCGGSLVSTHIVISAAHCFWEQAEALPASLFAVAVGKLYRPWNNMKDEAQKSDVVTIQLPPRFQGAGANFQDDIAVLVVHDAIQFRTFVRPVCLGFDVDIDRLQLPAETRGKVAGWGLTAANGNASAVLQVIDLPYVEVTTCLKNLPPSFREFVTSDKICAGTTDNSTGLCRGDSGGGLAFPVWDRGAPRYFLHGVVSTAPNDDNYKCNTNSYTTFTEVRRHELFIKQYWSGADEDNAVVQGESHQPTFSQGPLPPTDALLPASAIAGFKPNSLGLTAARDLIVPVSETQLHNGRTRLGAMRPEILFASVSGAGDAGAAPPGLSRITQDLNYTPDTHSFSGSGPQAPLVGKDRTIEKDFPDEDPTIEQPDDGPGGFIAEEPPSHPLPPPPAFSAPQRSDNPCSSNPCGSWSWCRVLRGRAVCACRSGYVGSPPYCRPCISDRECDAEEACVGGLCNDPCEDACGTDAACRVHEHVPACSCWPGDTGDPFDECFPLTTWLAPVREPCSPSPCGEYAECRVVHDHATCKCQPGYFGSPPNCRGCLSDEECDEGRACVRGSCTDACRDACGMHAACFVRNHVPACSCPAGYTGDPFELCTPAPPPPVGEPTMDSSSAPAPAFIRNTGLDKNNGIFYKNNTNLNNQFVGKKNTSLDNKTWDMNKNNYPLV